ncbi:hypothetical protein [Maricaulis sp.]|uniref:hypothetical protein n=1 Tax=Maricaulis sp. TaxID=1486257 RepID=UPI0026218946|nr:hypothetical protein [Maricaulis sp.]
MWRARQILSAHPVSYSMVLLILAFEVSYGLAWAVLGLAARLGFLGEGALNPHMSDFIASTSFLQETAFFGSVAFLVGSLLLLLAGSRRVLPVFVAAFLLDKLDWFALTGNEHYDNILAGQSELSGYAAIAAHTLVIYLLFSLRLKGDLR